jgi:formate C-acetyltransferase
MIPAFREALMQDEEDSPENREKYAQLAKYAGINVRIGGWQTPFITLPLDHMENYIKRPVEVK